MAGLIPLARRLSVALKLTGSNVDWVNTRPVKITPSETPERNLMLAEVLCAYSTYTELQMQPQNRAGSGAEENWHRASEILYAVVAQGWTWPTSQGPSL